MEYLLVLMSVSGWLRVAPITQYANYDDCTAAIVRIKDELSKHDTDPQKFRYECVPTGKITK